MKFTFITLFESLIRPYFEDSILKRAIDSGVIEINFVNPRDFSQNKHKKCDDYKLGGGAGLLMTPQPLFDAICSVKKDDFETKIIFPAPAGKLFHQNDAKRLAKTSHIIFICGRYEGIDERVFEVFADEIFSIGDYILTGGELPAVVMSDAISRNIDGVLGNCESLNEESFEGFLLEAPSFTKPNEYEGLSSPSVFLKGNHSKIHAFKKELSTCKTKYYRTELYISDKQKEKNEKQIHRSI